jgi:hypothetical protein
MTGRITRRELLFQKLPTAVAAGCFFGAANLLAEPIQRHKMRLNEFANHLLLQHWDRFLRLNEKRFKEFCDEHGLDGKDDSVAHGFVASLFFHELIKEKGILKNVYMLIDERPARLMKIEGDELLPLSGDELMLRGPGVMLRDMFSGKPKYQLGNGRKIHCFGDCDEYEMAYVTILRSVGIDARIVMSEASHVKTQIEIKGKQILVDNTRNTFGKAAKCKGRCKDYRTGELGFMEPKDAKRYLNRINKMAMAGTEVRIWPKGERRVDKRIDKALRRLEMATGVSEYQEETGQSPSSPIEHRE